MVFAWFLHKSEASMVEVCLIWDQTSNGPFLTLNHFLGIFAGWDFGQALIFNVFLHIFKIKDHKQTEIENILQNKLKFLGSISKCYSFSENMAYFLAKTFDTVTDDHSVAKTDKLDQKGYFGLE